MKIRVAPSIGALERTFEEAWGLETYDPLTDQNEPTVFAGLYGLPDFYTLWRHKGKKYVWFAGSDIRHFLAGYWLDQMGRIRINSIPFAEWISENCESWVENEVEYEMLKSSGIDSKVCPSFLGDVKDYEVSYKWSGKPKLYTSVSGDDFELYNWQEALNLADQNTNIEFYFYGNTIKYPHISGSNIIFRGRVSKEQMNLEIKEMQGALRLVKMEGFSEIIAKSLLWGQWPISLIDYPHTLKISEIGAIFDQREPNVAGREWLLDKVNQYPWCTK